MQSVEPEVLFSMLIRQMRLLLSVNEIDDNPIDEVKRLKPWQTQKLKKQATFFTDSDLIATYKSLHEIDYRAKTGKASLPLSSTIDIWLLKL